MNLDSTGDSSLMPAIPVMAVVFLSYIIVGMALPVLPRVPHTTGECYDRCKSKRSDKNCK